MCIGKKPSDAECYVDGHDNLVELLQALARVSNRGSRYYSTHDFGAQPAALPVEPDSPPTPEMRGLGVAALGTSLGRSSSMPSFGASGRGRAPIPPRKVPSWVSFQDAFQTGFNDPASSAVEAIPEDADEADDDAAMFF